MTNTDYPLHSLDLPQRPLDPQFWWREVCFVTPTLAMSAGISPNHDIARE